MLRIHNNFKKGYTLAEVLVVVAIFTLMMIALPPLTRKMFKVETAAKEHGRFECFYEKKNDGTNELKAYLNGKDVPDAAHDTYCEYIPSSNSVYIMIHAVGGGGAGYKLDPDAVEVTDKEAFSYLYYSSVSLWPDWFKYVMDHRSGLSLPGDNFETKKTFSYVKLPYGQAGEAGKRVSMIFPRLRNVTLRMYPGTGGSLADGYGPGNDGSYTKVDFRYGASEAWTNVITALGGNGGSSKGDYGSALVGGKATDYGVGSLFAVKRKDSGFDSTLEGFVSGDNTKINSDDNEWPVKAGFGGNGSYYYVKSGTGKFSYQINSYKEIINSDGTKQRKNNWKVVTSKIPQNFFRREDAANKGSCVISDGKVKITAWCTPETSTTDYDFKCLLEDVTKDAFTDLESANAAPIEIKVKEGRVYSSSDGTPWNPDNPSGYSSCEYNVFERNVTCETDRLIENSYYTCVFENDTDFKCPDGIEQDADHTMCSAGAGGNGAVVILW